MDRSLYLSSNTAGNTMLAQMVNSHNLANANTPGFKADLAQFRSMPVFGEGHPSRVYAEQERPSADFTEGTIYTTGNSLDLAINGEGWFAIQTPDGGEAYQRAGNFHLSNLGLLTTADGLPVLGNGGPVTIPPADEVIFGADGTISIRPIGQAENALAIIDRIKLVKPDTNQLEKGEDGLFRLLEADPVLPDATVQIVQGALEASNVNMIHALIDMIELSRQFEMQIQSMNTAKENDELGTSTLRIS